MSFLNDNDSKTPTFRQWCKSTGEKTDSIEGFMLSQSEEWIIITCENSVAFVSFKSTVGKQLWEAIKTFNGIAKGLYLQSSQGKLGFSIEISKNQGYWEWDGKFLTFDPDWKSGKGEDKMAGLWAKMTGELSEEAPKKAIKKATSTNPNV